MQRHSERIKGNQDKLESEDYNSNNYNSDDSFIADENDSEVEESEDYNPIKEKKTRKKKLKKKTWAVSKEEVNSAKNNLKSKNRNRRLKKMKEISQKKEVDDFVDYDDDDMDINRRRNGRMRNESGLESENDYNQPQFSKVLGEHQDLLKNIFNDDMFAEDLQTNNRDNEQESKANNDFSKMLPPEEQQKHFLTEMDKQIKKKDIPERLQIRFQGRPEIVPEEMVHESRWIVKKLIQKNNLSEKLDSSLEIKVYGVLENLLWKNQEIMYIWVYSRQDITSNVHSTSRTENNYELTLDDLWFIYFADEEWQKCSEMRMSLTKLMQLLESHEELKGLAKMAIESAMDLDNLTTCYEFLKFRLKSYLDEEEIEDKLEQNQQKEIGNYFILIRNL